jgi:hypothetical protein
MELAARIDPNPHGHLRPNRLEVMVMQLGTQDKIPRPRANGFRLALDVPVDLAAHDHPPLVVLVIMRVVRRPRRMHDDKRLDIVAHNQWLRPRLAIVTGGEQFIQPRMQRPRIEDRQPDSHVRVLLRNASLCDPRPRVCGRPSEPDYAQPVI